VLATLLGTWLVIGSAEAADPTLHTSTLRVDPYPRAVAVNPATDEIFVVSEVGYLTIIDGASHRSDVIRIAHGGPELDYAGSAAVAIDTARNRIYVSNFVTGSLSVFDRTTDQISVVGGGLGPGQSVVNAITNTIYVPQSGYYPHTGMGTNKVRVVDGATLESHDVIVGVRPTSIAVDETRNLVWVANAGDLLDDSNVVTVLDGATEQRTDVTVVPTPGIVAVDRNLGLVVVAGFVGAYSGVPSISLVDEETLGVRNLTLPSGSPRHLVVNPLTGKAYVSTVSPATLLEIDERTGELVDLAVTDEIGALAVDSVRNRIYATHPGNDPDFGHTVSVVDGATRAVVEVQVGSRPYDVTVNPADGTVWTANYADATTTVVYEDSATCVRCPRILLPR